MGHLLKRLMLLFLLGRKSPNYIQLRLENNNTPVWHICTLGHTASALTLAFDFELWHAELFNMDIISWNIWILTECVCSWESSWIYLNFRKYSVKGMKAYRDHLHIHLQRPFHATVLTLSPSAIMALCSRTSTLGDKSPKSLRWFPDISVQCSIFCNLEWTHVYGFSTICALHGDLKTAFS